MAGWICVLSLGKHKKTKVPSETEQLGEANKSLQTSSKGEMKTIMKTAFKKDILQEAM